MDKELHHQTAIVTGGGSGIGLAIARLLAQAGASVVLAGRSFDRLSAAASGLSGEGLQAAAVQVDVASQESCQELAGWTLQNYGRIDILVNNAGLFALYPSADIPENEFRLHIDVMLTGAFLCTQAVAVQAMIPQKSGSIINIGSIGSVGGWPMRTAYNAAKAGLAAMTADLATEWAQYNIRLNCLEPGVTRTDMLQVAIRKGLANPEKYTHRTPMQRLAEVEEIAAAALFLASPRSRAISGTSLRVDGGWVPWSNPTGIGYPEQVSNE